LLVVSKVGFNYDDACAFGGWWYCSINIGFHPTISHHIGSTWDVLEGIVFGFTWDILRLWEERKRNNNVLGFRFGRCQGH
jgi:hypothetical protein